MLESIENVLIRRDGITYEEARALVAEARAALLKAIEAGEYCAAEEICYEYFGLEPDYIDQLL